MNCFGSVNYSFYLGEGMARGKLKKNTTFTTPTMDGMEKGGEIKLSQTGSNHGTMQNHFIQKKKGIGYFNIFLHFFF